MTDPIADYLTRLRNAINAKHRVVEIPASNLKKEITKILFEKGYIRLTKLTQSKNLKEYLLRVYVSIPDIKICRVLLMVWVLLSYLLPRV